MARAVNSADNYISRVLKYIPSEIVMAYVAVDGILRSSYDPHGLHERQILSRLLWITLFALTVLTPLWLWRVMRVRRPLQLFLSTLSVPVWLFALGGPFTFLSWYEPAFGAIALPFYTLIVPIISGSSF
jgi:hypothetical protein